MQKEATQNYYNARKGDNALWFNRMLAKRREKAKFAARSRNRNKKCNR